MLKPFFAMLIGSLASIAMAQDLAPVAPAPASTPAPNRPGLCRADYERLCQKTKLRKGPAVECLVAHLKSLSPACRAMLEEKLKDHPCAADRMKLCPGKEKKDGWTCLKKNDAKVSKSCKAKMRALKSK